jgi:hypothetical protein
VQLNQTTRDWHTRPVILREAKGLAARFFAALKMTLPKGRVVKCTNVMGFDLATEPIMPLYFGAEVLCCEVMARKVDKCQRWNILNLSRWEEVHKVLSLCNCLSYEKSPYKGFFLLYSSLFRRLFIKSSLFGANGLRSFEYLCTFGTRSRSNFPCLLR